MIIDERICRYCDSVVTNSVYWCLDCKRCYNCCECDDDIALDTVVVFGPFNDDGEE